MPQPRPERTDTYASIEELVAGEAGPGVHVECARETGRRALRAVRETYAGRRCAYLLEGDRGFDRDTVASYLRFFARIADGGVRPADAAGRFGLAGHARTKVGRLSDEQRALLGFARMSLFEPEVCFCERPLMNLGAEARAVVLGWMGERAEAGAVVVTVNEPLREALLMPGDAWWEEDGRLFRAQTAAEPDEDGDDGDAFAGDEVRVCKVVAKSGDATLLFDPREVDFVESLNRQNFVSVRGQLYPTASSLDELEAELERFGFFRCHRSYIVNVQKVVKVERYTRNSYNLTLSDARRSSIPLAKGRAEAMRDRYGWR